MTKRLGRTVAVFAAAGLAIALLRLLGVDVASWFDALFDALTAVDAEYVVLGLALQTLETFLSGIAWLAILRVAYPQADIQAPPILTAYAVAVAGNDVLPASLGTVVMLVMLVMLTAIIPESTFPGLIGGQVVHKLFFVVSGAFVYLYLFLSVPGSFAVELELLDDHRALAVLVPAAIVIVAALVIRAFWSRLRGLWARAKQGGGRASSSSRRPGASGSQWFSSRSCSAGRAGRSWSVPRTTRPRSARRSAGDHARRRPDGSASSRPCRSPLPSIGSIGASPRRTRISAHSRYNALVRRLASFERAADRAR